MQQEEMTMDPLGRYQMVKIEQADREARLARRHRLAVRPDVEDGVAAPISLHFPGRANVRVAAAAGAALITVLAVALLAA
ncbi:MAG: hypothetical protein H0V36_06835 [Chloroflexi bacterium]|nr:hypothetical protein [Chloroflexota bacterium]